MYVQASAAARIAGITEHQLKEWCTRRALLSPDVPARGKGHHALFGWRSLLALRLLAVIHRQFGGTVTHWGPLLGDFRSRIEGTSFPSLFGKFALYNGERINVGNGETPAASATLSLPLDEHLTAISFAMNDSEAQSQLPLLPPLLVRHA